MLQTLLQEDTKYFCSLDCFYLVIFHYNRHLMSVQGEDLTTFGELCAEGTFRVSGAKALRHVFLFDQILLITKKKEEGILGYKAHIMVSALE